MSRGSKAIRCCSACPTGSTNAFVGPFVEFFRRNGRWAFMLLIFIGFYRVTDMVLGVMANPFYIDIGFSLPEIASVTKVCSASS